MPIDAVCASSLKDRDDKKTYQIDEIPSKMMGLDIGPGSVAKFDESISDARTIIWNGPMGVFEIEAFSHGTFGIAECVTNSAAQTIVGGGETDAAIHQAGLADKVSFISTGGGAFLEFLEGKELPGVAALKAACQNG